MLCIMKATYQIVLIIIVSQLYEAVSQSAAESLDELGSQDGLESRLITCNFRLFLYWSAVEETIVLLNNRPVLKLTQSFNAALYTL